MKIGVLCQIRDVQRDVYKFELEFEKAHGICLNEGMALCSLCKYKQLSSAELGEVLGLSLSNTSKVIRSIENKHYIKRIIGSEDKRKMYFSLTEKGKEMLTKIKCENISVPTTIEKVLVDKD